MSNNYNSKKGFEITQERIDVINTAMEYLHKFNELEKFVDNNFHGNNIGHATIFLKILLRAMSISYER